MKKSTFYPGIIRTVGNTPLVQFSRVFDPYPFDFYGKMESFNPGGSIKDRVAVRLIEDAIRSGKVGPHTTVVESTSGNMGIGLAQVCHYQGLKLILVVDPHINKAAVKLLEAYGAKLVTVQEEDGMGGYLQTRLRKVRQLLCDIPESFWPDQYRNRSVMAVHLQTWSEIVRDLGGTPDYVFVPTSTCGTLMGMVNAVAESGHPTRVIAVDARGSVVFGNEPAIRRIPGIGSSRKSDFLDADRLDGVVHVSDRQAATGCRQLLSKESVLAGGSSGAVIYAVSRYAPYFNSSARVVGILPDRGERYLDTVYSDDWVDKLTDSFQYEEVG